MTVTAVRGNLFFRKQATILRGKQAHYNNHRVAFYEDDYSAKGITAYVCISLFRLGVLH
jgi:hypothetical protein